MKCDERKPQCHHCEISCRDCHYESSDKSAHRKEVSGPPSAFHFPADHVWLGTPTTVHFVHEVNITMAETETRKFAQIPAPVLAVTSGEYASDRPPSLNGDKHDSPNSLMLETPSIGGVDQNLTLDLTQATSTWNSPHSINSDSNVNIDSSTNSIIAKKSSGLSLYLQGPREPLNDQKATRLLRHYIDNIASWLDINDPQRHFATFVPHLALRCPILLHAILAFSASHLSRFDGSCNTFDAIEYHDECVKGLIQALKDPDTAMDNVLPLSTVILRMYEMLSYERDHERHLRGCSSLFTHNRRNIEYRAMKRTAFWTYVREEILVALPNSRPTNLHPSSWKADIRWEGEEDYVWTNQITWLTAEVVNFCFRDDVDVNESNWSDLQHEVDLWKQNLPETFQPLYVLKDSKPFPEIAYICTWHIIGMQFYHLAKVLLALYKPHHANGINFLHLARSIEVEDDHPFFKQLFSSVVVADFHAFPQAEIRSHTIELCGMVKALGSKHPGALVNAVQPLIICGRTLKDLDEQLELVNLLQQIDQNTAWSTAQGVKSLQEAWGLNLYNQ